MSPEGNRGGPRRKPGGDSSRNNRGRPDRTNRSGNSSRRVSPGSDDGERRSDRSKKFEKPPSTARKYDRPSGPRNYGKPGNTERSQSSSSGRTGPRDYRSGPSKGGPGRDSQNRSSFSDRPRDRSSPSSARGSGRPPGRYSGEKKETVFRPDPAGKRPARKPGERKPLINAPSRLPSGRRITKHKHDRKVVLPARPDADRAIEELEWEGAKGPALTSGKSEKTEWNAESIFEEPVRINRYLARAGFGSRQQVEDYVTSGRVKVNGKTIQALDTKVGPGDLVTLDGKRVRFTEGHIYQAFYKPAGYAVSARSFPDNPSIYEILPEDFRGLKYAGRLDQESRGLIILSNDGEFLNQVMHPARRVTKRYLVTLDELPEAEELTRSFYKGVPDDGELLRAVRVGILDREKKLVEVVLSEGRKRQIRRMFAALEVKVLDLYRVSVGFLSLENRPVKEGESFPFEPEELFGMKKSDPVLGDFDPWKKER